MLAGGQTDVVLGDNMNISRTHAKIIYNFDKKVSPHTRLAVLMPHPAGLPWLCLPAFRVEGETIEARYSIVCFALPLQVFELTVMGKNGVTVGQTLYTPASGPCALKSQDHLVVGERVRVLLSLLGHVKHVCMYTRSCEDSHVRPH